MSDYSDHNDPIMITASINELRTKQLYGGGISDEEVMQGIRLLVQLRKIRAGGKKLESELPSILEDKLEDLF